ncbi:MAG: P-II family nitrogen regulator [Acidobacteria bacterium]|nr:P-II family nitrogen regulator [Acidobacteriota bacterium]
MKEIKAIIQPFLLSKVVDALKQIDGLPGVTVSEVHGFGRAQAVGSPETITEGGIDYVNKSKLEVVVSDELADQVIAVIREKARTGNPGDGKIFVHDIGDVIRIRTGEHGESAI